MSLTRTGVSRVRTGCTSCSKLHPFCGSECPNQTNCYEESRHIKCDEGYPSCNKCILRGYQCVYVASSRQRPQIRFVYYTSEWQSNSFPEEKRAIEFFRLRTAQDLVSPFRTTFWSEQVILLAEHQPAVRHALVALGTAHEAFLCGQAPISDFVLRHYNKAINTIMIGAKTNHSQTEEAALLTSIIFASLEILRGCYHSAFKIVTSATNVLQERCVQDRKSMEAILPGIELRRLFMRLTYQVMDLSGSEFDHHSYHHYENEVPETFEDYRMAMAFLESLYCRMSHLHKTLDRLGTDAIACTNPGQKIQFEMRNLQNDYDKWRSAFNRMKSRAGYHSSATKRDPAVTSIEIVNNVLKIMLSVSMIPAEDDFDHHIQTFEAIVNQAEALIGGAAELPLTRAHAGDCSPGQRTPPVVHRGDLPALAWSPSSGAKPAFTLSTGCIGPLYFVAARCRSPPVRRRALVLLQTGYRKEGLWDSRIAASIAEKVIQVEESSMRSTNMYVDRAYADDLEVRIPAARRVKLVNVVWGEDERGSATYTRQHAGTVIPGDRLGGLDFQDLAQW